MVMETRRKFEEDFKQGAVRIVRETGKPIARVAMELGINESTPPAAPSSCRTSGAVRSSKAANAAGKNSRRAWRSRSRCLVRSQISVLCARVTTLTASASTLSSAIGL
jgi:hypothetical protein